VDFLQRNAGRLGALGASGFGAGFGGAVFAVVPESRAPEFIARWEQEFRVAYPRESVEARFFTAAPSDGMRLWDGEWSGRWVDRAFARR
jgi:galactokinase